MPPGARPRGNTQLGGHVFGYHGDPKAILRGRIIALVLLTLYTWGFAFSRVSGLVTIAVLSAVGPWLFMRGQQFALANSSFLGLRFGFRTDPWSAYLRLLPVLALWWAPELLELVGFESRDYSWLIVPATLPWMHHQLKAFQHGNATYGNRSFAFAQATPAFYAVYAKSVGLVLLAVVAFGLAMVGIAAGEDDPMLEAASSVRGWLYALGFGLAFYLIVGPYYAARLQQVVWSQTQLGDIRFRMPLRASELYKLAFKNAALTLLTCGLYWPWAAVALARYKLGCLELESNRSMAAVAMAVAVQPVDAAGDGSLDAFGLDIGL
jgi:uncharacterized membrane protein YjgN (DUF898 family)